MAAALARSALPVCVVFACLSLFLVPEPLRLPAVGLTGIGVFGFVLLMSAGALRLFELTMYLAALTMAWNGLRLTDWMTVSDVFLLAAFMLAPLALPLRFSRSSPLNAVLFGVGLIIAGGLLGAAVGGQTDISPLLRLSAASVGLLILFALWQPPREKLEIIVWLWVGSAAVSAMYDIGKDFGLMGSSGRSGGIATGFKDGVNSYVRAVGPAIAFCWYKRPIGLLAGSILALFIIASIMSGSRIALVALFVMAGLFLLTPKRVILLSGMGIAGLVLIGIFSYTTLFSERNAISRFLLSLDSQDQRVSSNEQRLILLQRGLTAVEARPFTGTGFREDRDAYQRQSTCPSIVCEGKPYHIIYLQIWAAAGLLGVLGIGLIVVVVLKEFLIVDKSDLLRVGLIAATISVLVTGLFTPVIWERWIWFTLALALSAQPLRQRD
ncbi:MAG: hypothetical protein GEU71_14645, partial [Actinobacteria bacterium]|nr:hypothetical protein [Actinomycetota bacterium]